MEGVAMRVVDPRLLHMERHLFYLLVCLNGILCFIVAFVGKKMIDPDLLGLFDVVELDLELLEFLLESVLVPAQLGLGLPMSDSILFFGYNELVVEVAHELILHFEFADLILLIGCVNIFIGEGRRAAESELGASIQPLRDHPTHEFVLGRAPTRGLPGLSEAVGLANCRILKAKRLEVLGVRSLGCFATVDGEGLLG